MSRAFLSLAIFCFVATLVLHVFGISIPYINLHLGKLQFFFMLSGIILLGISHPLWRRLSFGISLLFGTIFLFFSIKFAPVWMVPLLLFFPYRLIMSIYYRKAKVLRWVKETIDVHYTVFMSTLTVLVVVITYRGVLGMYFEGDEWYRFRTYIPAMRQFPIFAAGLIQTLRSPSDFGFHQSYVVNTLYPIVFYFFGTHATPYFLVSLSLHSLASILIGIFAFRLTKSKAIGIAIVLSFAVLASQSQAVTWIDAVLNTQLSVIFGFLSLLFMLRYTDLFWRRYLWISALFLLLALWSKETALAFVIPIFLLTLFSSKKKILSDLYPFAITLGMFLFFRFIPSFLTHTKSPLDLFSVLTDPDKRGLLSFRLWLFPLKMFSQTVIPQEKFMDMAVWFTDMQFPYFLSEKAVGGPTYASFIQSAVPEMLSYTATVFLFLLSWVLAPLKRRKLLTFCGVSFFFATMPIVLLTLLFPWWGTVSLIDSRHFYHLSWLVLLPTIFAIEGVSENLPKHWSKVVFAFLVGGFTLFQYSCVQTKLLTQHQTGKDRRAITSKIVQAVGKPHDKLIIYSTSNKSYYGFAEYMLPFQTSFAHMIPVLFSKELNSNGIVYPQEFYDRTFFPKGGLVAQGYEEKDGKAIGYYLDEKLLNRAVVEHQLNEQDIYGFRFDGNTSELEDVTGALRERISNFKKSRVAFSTWKIQDFSDDHLKFATDPSWIVNRKGNIISISDGQAKELFSIEPVKPNGRTHSQFSLLYGPKEKLRTSVRDYDFDLARIEYSFDIPDDNRLFLMAGNNVEFYILYYSKDAHLDLFLRTFDYWDGGHDAYLFGKDPV